MQVRVMIAYRAVLANDTISAGDGDDSVSGGAGSDSLLGGAGNDVIEGDPVLPTGNIVTNGNFASADNDGGTTPTGWTRSGFGTVFTSQGRSDGQSFALGGASSDASGGTLSQDLTTVAGAEYQLNFDAGIFNDASGTLTVTVEHSDGTIETIATITDGTSMVFQHAGLSLSQRKVEAQSSASTLMIQVRILILTLIMSQLLLLRLQMQANDTIDAGAGNDTVAAGSGNDTINAGAGDDSVDAGSGDDSISGGAGADTISAGAGNDTIPLALVIQLQVERVAIDLLLIRQS